MILNLVGYILGVTQSASSTTMKPLHMLIKEITCHHRRAGHLHHHGNRTHQHWGPITLYSSAGNIPQLAEPLRYYNLQYLNLIRDNPTLATGSAPHERPAAETLNWILHNHDDLIDNDDLPLLPTCPIPRPLVPVEPRNLSGELVPPPGHRIVMPPP